MSLARSPGRGCMVMKERSMPLSLHKPLQQAQPACHFGIVPNCGVLSSRGSYRGGERGDQGEIAPPGGRYFVPVAGGGGPPIAHRVGRDGPPRPGACTGPNGILQAQVGQRHAAGNEEEKGRVGRERDQGESPLHRRDDGPQAGHGAVAVEQAGAQAGDGQGEQQQVKGVADAAVFPVEQAEGAVVGGQFVDVQADEGDQGVQGQEKMAARGDGDQP